MSNDDPLADARNDLAARIYKRERKRLDRELSRPRDMKRDEWEAMHPIEETSMSTEAEGCACTTPDHTNPRMYPNPLCGKCGGTGRVAAPRERTYKDDFTDAVLKGQFDLRDIHPDDTSWDY